MSARPETEVSENYLAFQLEGAKESFIQRAKEIDVDIKHECETNSFDDYIKQHPSD